MSGCRPRIILLDFDGTIINTMEYYADTASQIIEEEAGIPREAALRMYMETAGMAFRDQLAKMGIRGETSERIARRFEDAKESVLRRMRLDPRVKWFVGELRRRGLLVYLSTNNECHIVRGLGELVAIFDGILCHDPVSGTRKGREHVKALKQRYGIKSCEIVFVGDSDYDITLYGELGVRTIKTRGLWIDGRDILEYIDRMLNAGGARN